jgi:hypothetical protein
VVTLRSREIVAEAFGVDTCITHPDEDLGLLEANVRANVTSQLGHEIEDRLGG